VVALITRPIIFSMINICIAILIFIIDLQFPSGIAAGVPYVGVIMFSLWLPKSKHTIYFAVFCSLLTIVGFYLSPMQNPNLFWHAVLNRLATLAAIWVTTILATYRKTMAKKLRNSEQRQSAILAASLDPMVTFDQNGIISSASNSIYSVFGWSIEELIGQNIKVLLAEPLRSQFIALLKSSQILNGMDMLNNTQEITAMHINNREFSCEMSLTKVSLPELHEKFFTAVLRDISDRKQTENQLIWLSTHDELTGIYNRRYFNKQINIEWRRLIREKNPLGVIILDIDYFKNYNDTLGHQAGDECLKMIAQVLPKRLKRAFDFAARYGGEEFIVLLPNTPIKGVTKIANLIKNDIFALNIPHPVSAVGGRVTVSMGLTAMLPTKACTFEVLIRRADHALYQAKNSGRDRFVIFQESHKSAS